MTTWKRIAALLGAGALGLAMFGTALASSNYATVDGHEAHSSAANDPSYWGSDCTKLNAGEGDLGEGVDSYDLTSDYDKVVVKSGAGTFANTIFNDALAGQHVWADTNGNSVFDPGGAEGDQAISHIIFCGPADSETEEPSFEQSQEAETDEPSFEQSLEAETDEPTEPPTNTIGGGTSGPADGAWLLVVALGVFLASVVVLTPARAKSR